MKNFFVGTSGLWTLEGISQCARDSAIAAAEKQKQTLGAWMTQAIGCYIQHQLYADRNSDWPNPIVSDAASDTFQSDLNEQSDASSELLRNMNTFAGPQPGNRGDVSAEPPRFNYSEVGI